MSTGIPNAKASTPTQSSLKASRVMTCARPAKTCPRRRVHLSGVQSLDSNHSGTWWPPGHGLNGTRTLAETAAIANNKTTALNSIFEKTFLWPCVANKQKKLQASVKNAALYYATPANLGAKTMTLSVEIRLQAAAALKINKVGLYLNLNLRATLWRNGCCDKKFERSHKKLIKKVIVTINEKSKIFSENIEKAECIFVNFRTRGFISKYKFIFLPYNISFRWNNVFKENLPKKYLVFTGSYQDHWRHAFTVDFNTISWTNCGFTLSAIIQP